MGISRVTKWVIGTNHLEGQGDLVIMEKKMETTIGFRVSGLGFRVRGTE